MTPQSFWTQTTRGSDLQAADLLQANTSGSDQKWQNRNQSVRITLTSNQKSGMKAFAQAAGPALQSALLMPCTSKQAANSTHPKSNNYCKSAVDDVPCGACYEVCPRLDEQPSSLLGDYLEITAGKAEFDIPRKQSGGAVTAILANALDTGLVDAVVTVTEDPWTLKPHSMVITRSEALIAQAGSRYNWWVPLVSSLKEAVVKRKYRNIAVVGVPCVVQAVRKMLETDHQLVGPYKKSIRFVLRALLH